LFDRICRENGIRHLLTAVRSPTTTGKIERFHRTMRQEFLTGRVFDDLPRPGTSSTPGSRAITPSGRTRRWTWPRPRIGSPQPTGPPADAPRPCSANGLAMTGSPADHDERRHLGRLAGDQLRQALSRPRVDVHLQGPVMQIWDGEELIKTVLRTNDKEVRKKRAARAS
jgi:hypothetical protein